MIFPRKTSIIVVALAVAAAACGTSRGEPDRAAASAAGPGAPLDAAPAARTDPRSAIRPADTPRIIVLGDSLTAGLGLPVEQSFPSLLQQRLDDQGYRYLVVNAGVSGDTSAGGLRRLEWSVGEGNPQILVVALGGNDGLRGLPPAELEKNLDAIITAAKRRGLRVILAGMEAPPNIGQDYTSEFRQAYRTLAKKHQIPLIPFLLEGVAGNRALNQPDGIHPNAEGARIVADLVWRTLEPTLTRDGTAPR